MRSGRLWLLSALVLASGPAFAQSTPERYSVATAIGVDSFAGENVSNGPQVIVDVVATVQLADGWQLYVRPWFRLPRPGAPGAPAPPWDKELYQAALRYERSGRISRRLEAGYIASPIGLGMFDMAPNANPTIAGHVSYFVPMIPFDPGSPRSARPAAISATYPLGAVVTLSAVRWDARAAIVNSTPSRLSVVGGSSPQATPTFEAGAGVTPAVGLRLGVSFAHGAYLTRQELAPAAPADDRVLNLVGIEGEYAFGYSKLTGELIRSAFSVPGRSDVAYVWFIQGTHTLTPRWFVAARREGTSSPVSAANAFVAVQNRLNAAEVTVGFRTTREITLRASYYARQFYFAPEWDHQLGTSIVWSRRWW